MPYRVSFEPPITSLAVRLTTGGFMRVGLGLLQYTSTGKTGTTFIPVVTGDACTLTWTNDGGLDNPDPVNLRGKEGPCGPKGEDAIVVPLSNLDLEKILTI